MNTPQRFNRTPSQFLNFEGHLAMERIVQITVWLPDQRTLKEILSRTEAKLGCGSPRRDTEGNFAVTLFGTSSDVNKIKELGYRNIVYEEYLENFKKRQAEVSKIDRFQGGKIKPTGLGIKK
jgi:NAD(P)H-nitrite reductase large subunit